MTKSTMKIKVNRSLPFAVMLTVLVMSSLLTAYAGPITFQKRVLNIAGISYSVEIARTPGQRQQGLMYRQQLGRYEGMVFVYSRSGDYRIWMKNTRIPLQVIWVDEDQTVIGIKNLKPCFIGPCEIYGVPEPARYIIELNVETTGIKTGDKIKDLAAFD